LRPPNNSKFGNLFGCNSCMHCVLVEQMLVKFVSKRKYLTHIVYEVVSIVCNEMCQAVVLMDFYELKYT
jgi:hypothetical protein